MRSIIITGASSGIGFEAALYMSTSAPNEQIILPCINRETADRTVKRIHDKTGHKHLLGEVLDLSSLQSIRNLRTRFESQEHGNIRALINNAGVQYVGDT